MTQKSKSAKQKNSSQHPPLGISDADWAKTPVSVRKFVISILNSNQKQEARSENYVPKWPTWVMLLVNLLIIVGLSFFLADKVVVRCVTPHQISALSAAFISPVIFHIIWRNVYVIIPPNLSETISLGKVTVPLVILIAFLNEIHPWKLPSRLLGLLFLVLLIAGAFLNLSPYSPYRPPDEFSRVQGFSIQRLNTIEGLPDGGTLNISTNEKVIVEAIFLNKADTTCTWYSALSSENHKTGCSIILDEPSNANRDTLTVVIQTACGTRDHAALHVVVQP